MSSKTSFLIPEMLEQIGPTIQYGPTASWRDADVCFNITNYPYPTVHTHDYYEIAVVFSGSIVHNINGESYIMRRGDCCLIRPEDSHYFDDDPSQSQQNCLNANFMCRLDFMEKALATFGADCRSMLHAMNRPLTFKASNTVVSKIEKTCLYIQSPGERPTGSNLMIYQYDMEIVEIPEESILPARAELAKKGIYCEHTTAGNYAAYLRYCELHGKTPDSLITMCGAGLKSDH